MIAYTIEGAAAVTPLGKARIKDAVDNGELIAHYHPESSTTLILDDDLRDWIRSLPTEKRSA